MPVASVLALEEAMPDYLSALVPFATGTGLRQGEVFGLTWDRIDFKKQIVTVNRQLVSVTGNRPKFGPPETDASYRDVPFADDTLEALLRHQEEFGDGRNGLVFHARENGPLRRNRFSEILGTARDRAGLAKAWTMHDFRHFYASMLISQNASYKQVQERLGHENAMETINTYSHLWPNDDELTRKAVTAVLGAARAERAKQRAAEAAATTQQPDS
ncbi:site-specific integrase [Cellulosimicrobium sp. Marseille-Q4280]|uniref:site-specific integrase n=1 Tax=Cellulosimicrobium sp. Marseille-Q4280 TaxID=2937992 RepID=UPI0020411B05|nr:site-specific integrase [Cellulosimicrobium sp. Marseille-Q4280]